MCIAYGGQFPASFTGTRGAAWVITSEQSTFKGWHGLGYQCKVGQPKLVAGQRPPSKPTQWDDFDSSGLFPPGQSNRGAALLIPFPLKKGGRYDLIPTDEMPDFLKDMTRIPETITRSMGARSILKGLSLDEGGAEVKSYGVFTVVIFKTADPMVLADAIEKGVPEERRPIIDEEYLNFMMEAYNPDPHNPRFAFALFCYDPYLVAGSGKEAIPVVIVYQTSFPLVLFFPGLDEHDPAQLPNLAAQVAVDHQIAWSAPYMSRRVTQRVNYSVRVGRLGLIVPDEVMISTHHGSLPNGDFVVRHDDLKAGNNEVVRFRPPGFPSPIRKRSHI